jgi:dihydroorotate dehydrogenase
MSLYQLLQPLLFRLDAEQAHRLALQTLAAGAYHRAPLPPRSLATRLMGLDFANPVGLAAGMDKDGEIPDAALGLGFGFVEVGTVTPLAQSGNPKPRVFRLVGDRALINRLGFNNGGFDQALARLRARRRTGVVGINVGANRDSANRIDDYCLGVERFAAVADYITINISSPNTPGLRDLQEKSRIGDLLRAVSAVRDTAGQRPPVLVKLSPDIEDDITLGAIIEAVNEHGMDGVIVANTTLARDGLNDAAADQNGGMSGRPLFNRATRLLARTRKIAGQDLVLIGVGGVDSAQTAWDKLTAGANLVQLYTAMVYEGPGLPARIVAGLAERLKHENLSRITEIVGTQTDRWTADQD